MDLCHSSSKLIAYRDLEEGPHVITAFTIILKQSFTMGGRMKQIKKSIRERLHICHR